MEVTYEKAHNKCTSIKVAENKMKILLYEKI
jgi:hypothetical protein